MASTKPGTSLLVAIGLTTIIVLVSLGVTTVIISSIRDSANVTGANQSYYASEGALEKGLLENQNSGIGYSAPTAPVVYGGGQCTPNSVACTQQCINDPNQSTCIADCVALQCQNNQKSPVSASYTISGQVPIGYDSTTYGIPAPGTGNAGASAAGQQGSVVGCDALHPFTSGQFFFDSTTQSFSTTNPNGQFTGYDAIDHPCNWGKIKVGETVVIPLYYTCNSPDPAVCLLGDPTNLFTDPATQNLRIRLRTPCPPGKIFCSNSDRPDLNDTKGDMTNYNGNDPIVSWEVTGQSPDGSKTYTLQPIVKYLDQLTKWDLPTSIFFEEGNPYGINNARSNGNFEPFPNFLKVRQGVDPNGCRGFILNFLTKQVALGSFPLNSSNCADTNIWTTQDITKPVLKLTIIHSLEDKNPPNPPNDTIPYLEYQILTENTSAPPTDVMQTITAEGYSGSFKQVLQVNVPQESGLPAYVIQQ